MSFAAKRPMWRRSPKNVSIPHYQYIPGLIEAPLWLKKELKFYVLLKFDCPMKRSQRAKTIVSIEQNNYRRLRDTFGKADRSVSQT